MEWMILPLKRYLEIGGRSRRREYWMFFLFTIIVSIAAGIVDNLLGYGSSFRYATSDAVVEGMSSSGPVNAIVALGLIVPSLAVAFRRLHDTDRSAWWLLLVFVPIVGWITLLVFYCQDGTRGANRFGADPKGEKLTATH